MNPSMELLIKAGKMLVASLMAVGENNSKTPILQMSNSSKKGIILKRIEGIEMKYLISSLGAQEQNRTLRDKMIDRTPRVEKTCWKYPQVFDKNKYKVESKKGSKSVKLLIDRQGEAPEKQKN